MKRKAHLAVLSANLIFSVNFSVVKFLTPRLVLPLGLNVVRVLVSTLLFWMLLASRTQKAGISRADLPRFILCGLSGVALNQILFIKGLSMTYSTHASLLILCTPLLITAAAFFFLGERLTLFHITGLLLGITGATVLISSGNKTGAGQDILLGDIFVITNAVFYSFYFILVKRLTQLYHPLVVICWVFTIGSFVIVPAGWSQFQSIPWKEFTLVDFGAFAFIVLGATFLAYILNLYGLQHLNASATGAYIYLQPLFASAIAILFANESLGWGKILAAILIFVGVYLVNLKNRK